MPAEVKIEIDVAEDLSPDWTSLSPATGMVYSIVNLRTSYQEHSMVAVYRWLV